VCKRNPLLTYGSDWSPEDFYQPKFATGGVVFRKPFVPTLEEFKKQAEDLNVFDFLINKTRIESSLMKELEIIQKEYNSKTMKTDEIYTNENGKKFKLVPVEEELTIRDCMDPVTTFDKRGSIVPATYRDSMINYPTKQIAKKVLLYGLLQSVAYKLNGDWSPNWNNEAEPKFRIEMNVDNELDGWSTESNDGLPVFKSKELGKQAISIFAKSKFDLKKLYQ